ncbi:primosomal protein N' [Celeribacter halophilus]|uniref:Replication restart protein PriA n=1 Tax=Celeribacter halophilus TaxID=576117 RepID=A0A1I3RM53_9RHOB|nr:primosomal protein N' [Celeribacter halophilus]PZX12672.1 replication restart DNA helicase PriA [Celeribacter halophilus]SFJ47395.1 replication restart DNA helicase PriA [Celeribacter halophilus]
MDEAEFYPEGRLVAVLTCEPLDRTLDYKAPAGGVARGAFVEVPLGPRKVLGCVWGNGIGGFDLSKARAISTVLDLVPMREEMRLFLEKVAAYTLTPMPAMLRLATRAPGLMNPPGMRKVYRRGEGRPPRETEARQKVLDALEEYGGLSFTLKELADLAGVTSSVVKGLLPSGVIIEEDTPRDLPYRRLDADAPGKALTEAQTNAAKALREAVASERYSTTLLKGVTGSGKTEVYLEAVAECLKHGRQALVLLPEIALTAEFLTRFEERFGARPAEWHSGVTMTERRRVWKMGGEGGAQVVIGARSALFLPFRNLGLIVVDEEHDTSYKQEDGVLYNARDMAVLRASLCSASVVLASATPSLESWANVEAGKYKRLDLESRYGPAVMPDMYALDLRGEKMPSTRFISDALAAAVKKRMGLGEQSLLFLNRRGFAPVTICRACGYQITCDHCDARMVEHRFLKRLMCHQCGETKPMPEACPSCGVEGRLAPVGPGVERLAEEVTERFPEAKCAVLSSDLFASARALKEQIRQIAEGDTDIIIGTQLVAKGHNFPNLTLVGVIDADLGLQGSDLRAAERTFQLMRQVAGRAGRAAKKGVALLQTYQPEHPVIRAILAGDEEGFWRAEAAERKMAGVPPYGRMAGIILSGPDLAVVTDVANHLARVAGPLQRVGAQLFGPAPAPIARVRGRHRIRLLVKAEKGAPLQAALSDWVAQVKLPNAVRLQIDIDPQSFW